MESAVTRTPMISEYINANVAIVPKTSRDCGPTVVTPLHITQIHATRMIAIRAATKRPQYRREVLEDTRNSRSTTGKNFITSFNGRTLRNRLSQRAPGT